MMGCLSRIKEIPLPKATKGTSSVFPSEGGVALDPTTFKSIGIGWHKYNEKQSLIKNMLPAPLWLEASPDVESITTGDSG